MDHAPHNPHHFRTKKTDAAEILRHFDIATEYLSLFFFYSIILNISQYCSAFSSSEMGQGSTSGAQRNCKMTTAQAVLEMCYGVNGVL